MEQSATDFNLKERGLKARITRENTNFRRFSSLNLKSFREDFTTTISSTVSSPGYTIREEIDPSTYSFTAAIKALQAKSVCSWEHRLTLHSKWSDAEKYISNPLSGEVPLECLSAKTLSSRSFSSLTNRITVSHDLQHFHPIIQQHKLNITIQEKKKKKKGTSMTRDVGIQSTPQGDLSSSSPSSPIQPTTPSIEERRRKVSVGESGDSSSPSSTEKEKPETVEEVEERETKKEKELGRGRMMMRMKGGGRRGCLSLFKGLCLWQREKYYCNCKPRIKNINNPNPNPKSSPKFRFQINSCYEL